ncbi:cell wall protein [Aspergillus nomiae NRRL 13137]|uniref:Cell wall protein n=1 Tax=Aspergillus nomiae NRRL (strain ATCC 15546 / NRRL 13137 / CBS 260.88 / M93) TaxID=1509407 RepID=A0A0L1J498_ASPN3|nr:cell wall protein [Aspergillus nomiae NRRL 13137]KNG86485.1 cell wall protein [Aspergillus nomiae NRRL 13137]
MRVSSLSFLLYSLSLLAAVSGQSVAVTGGDVATSKDAAPTKTDPTTTSTSSTSSTSSSSSESTESTSTTSDTKPTSTKSDPTTTSDSTSEPTTDNNSDSNSKTSADNSSQTSQTPVVKTLTTVQTVSGTPVHTTLTTTSSAPVGATDSPSLNGEEKDSKSSGLSSNQKKTIIGVVVGVGGAILIGALGVVAWRIHARKRNGHDNDEATDLMSGTAVGSGVREKAPSPGLLERLSRALWTNTITPVLSTPHRISK